MQTLHRQSLADGRKKQNMLKQRGKRARQQRKLQLERLEDRRLLAGPELFAIRPNAQALLNPGDVLHIAPREFNLLFKGGADIDPNTIASGVRLVRANGDDTFGDGNDLSVTLGFAGLTDPNNPVQIVMRPASSAQFNSVSATSMFPDDLYRIEVIGTGAGALKNKAGQAFNSGNNFSLQFRLDLGAQVVAVIPQPISRDSGNPGTGLQQNRNQVVVYFDDQDLVPAQAQDPKYYRLVDNALTSNETTVTQDKMLLPASVVYDSVENKATLTFAADIPEGTYRLDLGYADEPNDSLGQAIPIGTLFDGSPFRYLSYLGEGTDVDGNGISNNTGDRDLYRVHLQADGTITVKAKPHDATFDINIALLDESGRR